MPNQFSSIWNDALDNALLFLKSKGLSGDRIARQLGFTRNKVIGRLDRLKQQGKASTEADETDKSLIDLPLIATPRIRDDISAVPKTASHTSSGSFRPSIHLPAVKLPPPRPSTQSLFLPLVDLPADSCRFAVGGGTCCAKSHLFCGAPTYTAPTHEHHSPYCKTHYKMAYVRGY